MSEYEWRPPPPKNAIRVLSGENADASTFDPGISRVSSLSRRLTKTVRTPLFQAVMATIVPSGDKAMPPSVAGDGSMSRGKGTSKRCTPGVLVIAAFPRPNTAHAARVTEAAATAASDHRARRSTPRARGNADKRERRDDASRVVPTATDGSLPALSSRAMRASPISRKRRDGSRSRQRASR